MSAERNLAVGDRVIYHGGDGTAWGETGKIINLSHGRCMIRLDNGGDLFDSGERSFSASTPPDTIARTRRVLNNPAASKDALRGALRLLLAHIEQGEVPGGH